MAEVILNDDQAQTIRNAQEEVIFRDQGGKILARVSPDFTEEDIAEAKRRLATPGPRLTTQEVLDYLDSLDQQRP